MARVTAEKALETRTGLLEAAKQVLLDSGYAGLTTRAVSGVVGAPMSQIQYHFGSKEGMILALYEYMDGQLLERQNAMFSDASLKISQQWDLACDYLDDDLASGYVRVLHELTAAGWSSPDIGRVVSDGLAGWQGLLTQVARRAQQTFGTIGPFEPEDIAALVGSAFIGAEAFLLLGLEDRKVPLRRALRRFGDVIRLAEDQTRPDQTEGK